MISLINEEYHKVMEDVHDDEREDKDSDKEIDTEENEKDKKEPLFLSVVNSFFHNTNTTLISIFFIECVSRYSIEIQLPPPEYNI